MFIRKNALFCSFVLTCLVCLCATGDVSDNAVGLTAACGGTVRLRVIANSDDEYDQSVKYAVRDALIGRANGLFEDCTDISAACDTVSSSLALFHDTASDELARLGVGYGVRVRFVRQYCPVRSYGAMTFPAGSYRTLLVELGEAKGHNWFCVLYPPLCLDVARGDVLAERDVFFRCGFSESQIGALTANGTNPPVRVRFALIEYIKKMFIKQE